MLEQVVIVKAVFDSLMQCAVWHESDMFVRICLNICYVKFQARLLVTLLRFELVSL